MIETTDPKLKVLEGIELVGEINTSDEIIIAQVEQAIRRGHPQIWPTVLQQQRVALVGGGPSLASTIEELRETIFDGALLVTVNGAYQWCIERNLKPNAQIVIDARPENARFVEPDVPGCRYYLASQCHPRTWDAVEGRKYVGIFHATDPEGSLKATLDEYYIGTWVGVGGGTTVASRALALLRLLGYLRFDLFGIDSCWMGDEHHAYAQPENERDRARRLTIRISPTAASEETGREFVVSPWHVKQFEDFVQFIRVNGQQVLLNVHGDGLLAYALRAGAEVSIDAIHEKE